MSVSMFGPPIPWREDPAYQAFLRRPSAGEAVRIISIALPEDLADFLLDHAKSKKLKMTLEEVVVDAVRYVRNQRAGWYG